MKKTKKLLIALLSATCLTAGAFGLASCTTASTNDPAMYALYEKYVSGVEDGETALTYEKWLEETLSRVAEKGEKGDQGEQGEQGEPGQSGTNGKSAYELYVDSLGENDVPKSQAEWLESLVGSAGRGIEKVEMSTDGKSLLITFTGSTTPVAVTLPEDYTHQHVYGDEITVVIPATSDNDGIGYKKCIDDDHIELVVIPQLKYTVTLVNPDGTPASGIEVTINEGSATTDEDGVAVITGFGEVGDYAIEIDKEGYEVFGVQSTGKQMDFNLTVVNKAASGTGLTASAPLVFSGGEIGGTSVFGVYVNSEAADKIGVVYARLAASDNPAKYKVTVNSEYAYYTHTAPNNPALEDGNASFEVVVPAGTYYDFQLTLDVANLPADISYPGTVAYTVSVERLAEPAKGVYEIPIVLTVDKPVSVKTEPNALVYCAWSYDWNVATKYAFDVEKGQGAAYIGKDELYRDESTKGTENVDLTDSYYDISLNYGQTKTYYFAVQADENGEAVFTFVKYWFDGDSGKPYSVEVGKSYTGTVAFSGGQRAVWYQYTPEEDGNVTLAPQSADGETYTCNTYLYVYEGTTEGYDYEYVSALYVLAAKAGTTYYFSVSNEYSDGAYKFTIRDTVESDYGYSLGSPAELTLGEDYTVTAGLRYYKVTATTDLGRLLCTVKDAEGNDISQSVSIRYYSDPNYWEPTSNTLYDAGDEVYIMVYSEVESYVLTVNQTALEEVDHLFTVKSGETTIADVTVIAMNGTEEVARGTTNENGVATLNMLPGEYTIVLEGVSEDYNYYTKVSTTLPEDGSKDNGANYNVILDAKKSYTFTVKSGETTIADVTVTVKDGETVLVAGETDAQGEVTFSYFPGEYTVEVSGYEEVNYAYVTVVETEHDDDTAYELTLVEKVAYTVKVTYPNGDALAEVTVSLVSGTTVLASGTTDEDGSVIFNTKVVPGSYTVKVESVPENYLAAATTSATQTTVYVELIDITDAVTGASSSSDESVALSTGTTLVSNDEAENYYCYTTAGSGTVTVTVSAVNTEKAYIGSLYINESQCIYNGQAYSYYVTALETIDIDYRGYTIMAAVKITVSVSAGDTLIFGLNTGSEGLMLITIDDPNGTATPGDGDTPVTGNVLSVGPNPIKLTADEAYNGVEYTFTATEAGTYTISITDDVALVMDTGYDFDNPLLGENANNNYNVIYSYSFDLGVDESITFVLAYLYREDCSYTVTIEKATDEDSSTEGETSTEDGNASLAK